MRIVAGRFRGRRIEAPPGAATRPTSDRVREALFSILGPLDGERVLDLYAGSGALGIEALSRGAAHATFVDSAARPATAIRRNLETLGIGADEATVTRRDTLRFLRDAAGAQPPARFDLVFADPPYSSARELAGPLSELLPPLLAPEARIVTESDKRTPLELMLLLLDERVYGDTRIALHRGR